MRRPLKDFFRVLSNPDRLFAKFTLSSKVPEEIEIFSSSGGGFEVYAKYEDPTMNRIIAIVPTKAQGRKVAKEYLRSKTEKYCASYL